MSQMEEAEEALKHAPLSAEPLMRNLKCPVK